MADYPKMYALLCAAASEALDRLEEEETQQAASVLQKALLEAEELYIKTDLP